VTGASSGIGEAIASMLLDEGFEVIGIGRNFAKSKITNPNFTPVKCDVTDTSELIRVLNGISKTDVLVNCAGSAYYGLAENVGTEEITEMCRTDLEAPMVITGKLLPKLRESRGFVINICSVTSTRINTHAACYGALKAALRSYTRSLYEEVRKHGVKVCAVLPDLTSDTGLYRNADFEPSSDEGCHLLPEDVANAVKQILNASEGSVITELEIRPQQNKISKK